MKRIFKISLVLLVLFPLMPMRAEAQFATIDAPSFTAKLKDIQQRLETIKAQLQQAETYIKQAISLGERIKSGDWAGAISESLNFADDLGIDTKKIRTGLRKASDVAHKAADVATNVKNVADAAATGDARIFLKTAVSSGLNIADVAGANTSGVRQGLNTADTAITGSVNAGKAFASGDIEGGLRGVVNTGLDTADAAGANTSNVRKGFGATEGMITNMKDGNISGAFDSALDFADAAGAQTGNVRYAKGNLESVSGNIKNGHYLDASKNIINAGDALGFDMTVAQAGYDVAYAGNEVRLAGNDLIQAGHDFVQGGREIGQQLAEGKLQSTLAPRATNFRDLMYDASDSLFRMSGGFSQVGEVLNLSNQAMEELNKTAQQTAQLTIGVRGENKESREKRIQAIKMEEVVVVAETYAEIKELEQKNTDQSSSITKLADKVGESTDLMSDIQTNSTILIYQAGIQAQANYLQIKLLQLMLTQSMKDLATEN